MNSAGSWNPSSWKAMACWSRYISSHGIDLVLSKESRFIIALQWRHNALDGVSDHQPHDCLLNFLFRHRSKKASKLRATGLCAGNSPHKRPVTRKMFPFDDVIMGRIDTIIVCDDRTANIYRTYTFLQQHPFTTYLVFGSSHQCPIIYVRSLNSLLLARVESYAIYRWIPYLANFNNVNEIFLIAKFFHFIRIEMNAITSVTGLLMHLIVNPIDVYAMYQLYQYTYWNICAVFQVNLSVILVKYIHRCQHMLHKCCCKN